MQPEEVRNALVEVLTEIQVSSGRVAPDITINTHLVGDLEGFDSLNAVEAGILLSDALNMKIDFEFILSTPFGYSPTVGDIVDRIVHTSDHQEGVFHGQPKFQYKSRNNSR